MGPSATDLLRRDHRRMEEVLVRFERELSDPQGIGLEALARTFDEIRRDLALHFRREEEVFYPAFRSAADTGYDTSKLEQEHSELEGVLSAFESLLGGRGAPLDPPPSTRAEIAGVGWELWNHIHHHMAEEESGLLAFADRVLDSAAQDRLARDMIARG